MLKRFSHLLQAVFSILLAALCGVLLIRSGTVREGVRAGLVTSAEVIIPSLYLFMAVSGAIAESRAGDLLSRPFGPLTRRFLKLPACMGSVLILSMVGGYPIGAKSIAVLLERKRISREDAGRALCFCCNAGPSFVVTAVGTQMLGSTRAGVTLLAAHLAASLLIGVLLSLRLPVPPKEKAPAEGLPFSEAFIRGVNGATAGILAICSYVVVFSALGALLRGSGLAALLAGRSETAGVLLIGLLEVTTGCLQAAALPGKLPLILIPLFISFAGFSIFFQIRATLQPYRLRYGRFLLCRVLHALLTLLFSYPLLQPVYPAVAAFQSAVPPVSYHTPNTPLVTLLLLGVSAMALWNLGLPAPQRIDQKEENGSRRKKG